MNAAGAPPNIPGFDASSGGRQSRLMRSSDFDAIVSKKESRNELG